MNLKSSMILHMNHKYINQISTKGVKVATAIIAFNFFVKGLL